MKRNQETSAPAITESVAMDSRKFLSAINNSAQSQITFFESAVAELGKKYGTTWKLTALLNNKLFIEDTEKGGYYTADYARQRGGRVTITDIKQVKVNEGEKSQIFESACASLIDAIESDKPVEMESALSRIAANRFRSRVVPHSGMVKTKDGVIRHVSVRDGSIDEERINAAAIRIAEDMAGGVQIVEGKMIGTFQQGKVQIPITEMTIRKVIARNMREAASNSYWNDGFQTIVESIAGLITRDTDEDLRKAIDAAAKLVTESQELALLTKPQLAELVSNTLATRGVFSEAIVNDTSALIRRVSMKINRDDIMEAWRKTAKLAQHPVMLENVSKLEGAADFDNAYDSFLGTIFESAGDIDRKAALAGLELLKQYATNEEDKQAADELISKLSNNALGDDGALYEAQNLLARVQDNLKMLQGNDLSSFDQVPGAPTDDVLDGLNQEAGAGQQINAGAGNGSGTVININTAQGGEQAQGQAPAAPAAPAPAPTEGDLNLGSEDDQLGGDLGGLDDLDIEQSGDIPSEPKKEEGGEDDEITEDDLKLESKKKEHNTLLETIGLDSALELLDLADGGDQQRGEDVIPPVDSIDIAPETAVKQGGQMDMNPDNLDSMTLDNVLPESVRPDPNYGIKPLSEDIADKHVKSLEDIIAKRNLKPEDVDGSIDELAGSVLVGESGLDDPKRMAEAKKQLIGAYASKKAVEKRPEGQMTESKEENKIQWIRRDKDGILATFKGVHFILDHASPAALLSVDGKVEVPIPEGMVPAAMFIAEVSKTEADGKTFLEWLDSSIEQFRPVDKKSEEAINEAVAKLVVSPDVKIEIEVKADDAAVAPNATPAGDVVIAPEAAPEVVKPEDEPKDEPKAEEPAEPKEEPKDGELPPFTESEEEEEEEEEDEDEEMDDDENIEEAVNRILGITESK